MVGSVMDNELEKMWKNVVIAYFSVLSQRSPRETEGNREDLRMVGVPADILTRDLLNAEALLLDPVSRRIELRFMSR
jgi:hypothetical protein